MLASLGFAGAVGLAAAQNPDAPLADTKRQLQSLQKDQAARQAGADGAQPAFSGAVPVPETPVTLQLPPLPSTQTGKERDAKQKTDARRNWLLDGYDKLNRRNDGTLAPRTDGSDAESEENPPDPADPDYFLRVYEKQRAETLARRNDSSEARPATGGGADAFAPFLQHWLASSPVRDALRDVAEGRAGGAASTPDGALARDGSALPGGAVDVTRGAGASNAPASLLEPGTRRDSPAPNPFLQALGLPPAPEASSAGLRSPTAVRPSLPATVPPELQLPTVDQRKSTPSRTTTPPPRDEKKYFPQLKKF